MKGEKRETQFVRGERVGPAVLGGKKTTPIKAPVIAVEKR